MLGTYLMKVRSKDRRRGSCARRREKIEETMIKNLSLAQFHAQAPPLDERRKAIRCHCIQSSENFSRQVEKCRIHKALKVFYR